MNPVEGSLEDLEYWIYRAGRVIEQPGMENGLLARLREDQELTRRAARFYRVLSRIMADLYAEALAPPTEEGGSE